MKNSISPKTSIVIINWNGAKYLKNCLNSIFNQTYHNFEVIIVDNNSDDDSLKIINCFTRKIKLIINNKNLGFAKANNQAIEIVIKENKSKYVVTLNNDTVVNKNWLYALIQAAENDNRIAACGSLMLYMNNRNIINSAGIWIFPDGTGINRGRNQELSTEYTIKSDVFGVCAGSALYRINALKEVGVFDEKYFAYNEDVDLSWRLRLHGWRILFVPESIVFHDHSASTSSFSLFKIYYGERNRIWTLCKNFPLELIILSFPYSIFKYLSLIYLALRNKGHGKPYIHHHSFYKVFIELMRAWFSSLVQLPQLINQRREIFKNSTIHRKEIYGWFRKYSPGIFKAPIL